MKEMADIGSNWRSGMWWVILVLLLLVVVMVFGSGLQTGVAQAEVTQLGTAQCTPQTETFLTCVFCAPDSQRACVRTVTTFADCTQRSTSSCDPCGVCVAH